MVSSYRPHSQESGKVMFLQLSVHGGGGGGWVPLVISWGGGYPWSLILSHSPSPGQGSPLIPPVRTGVPFPPPVRTGVPPCTPPGQESECLLATGLLRSRRRTISRTSNYNWWLFLNSFTRKKSVLTSFVDAQPYLPNREFISSMNSGS